MKIGLLIAVSRELEAFLQSGEELAEETVAGNTVYKAVMEGHEIYAVCSGCGEIDAAAATMLLIVRYGCSLVMNFGVAGALDKDLKVEDLFAVEKVWHYDFDITPFGNGIRTGQYEGFADEFIPLDAGLARLTAAQVPGIRMVAAASGDKFVEDRQEKLRLRASGCSICEMELAAIALVCSRCGVKCLSIKCISDTFDGGCGDFNTNVKKSAEKAFTALRAVLRALR